MILIIDAYNVLKAEKKAKIINELERRQFINDVVTYATHKGHSAVIIFDGGSYPFPFVSTIARGQLVYCGFSMTADDYIRRYLVENKHKNLFLISSDRELIRKARQCNVEHMGGYEFYQKMKDFLDQKAVIAPPTQEILKLTERDDPDLDDLMIKGAERIDTRSVLSVQERVTHKAGTKRLSKTERITQRKRDKI